VLIVLLASSISTVFVIPVPLLSAILALSLGVSMYADRLLYRDGRKLKLFLPLLLLWREWGQSQSKIAWKQGRIITREAAIMVTLNSITITRWVGMMSPGREIVSFPQEWIKVRVLRSSKEWKLTCEVAFNVMKIADHVHAHSGNNGITETIRNLLS
jgi:hypothetical protein